MKALASRAIPGLIELARKYTLYISTLGSSRLSPDDGIDQLLAVFLKLFQE